MPRYDYRCVPCDTTFEVVRSASSTDGVLCPDCATPAKRVFTPVGVVFKGSGFHTTDYRSEERGRTESTDTASPGSSCEAPSACESCPARSDD